MKLELKYVAVALYNQEWVFPTTYKVLDSYKLLRDFFLQKGFFKDFCDFIFMKGLAITVLVEVRVNNKREGEYLRLYMPV